MPLPCLPLPLAWQLSLLRNLEAQHKQNFSWSFRVNYLVQPNENTTKLCLFGLSTKSSLVKSQKGAAASRLTTLTKSITSCVSFFATQTNLGSHQASHSALLVITPVIQLAFLFHSPQLLYIGLPWPDPLDLFLATSGQTLGWNWRAIMLTQKSMKMSPTDDLR